MHSLGGVFPVLERPPPLLELLDGGLGEAAVLEPSVEVLDVERGELLVAHDPDGLATEVGASAIVVRVLSSAAAAASAAVVSGAMRSRPRRVAGVSRDGHRAAQAGAQVATLITSLLQQQIYFEYLIRYALRCK